MTLFVVYILLALGVSFLCSVMEAVLLSITPGFVSAAERERPALGKRLRVMKDDVERPLAAILSLNTIAHTVGAAGAGAQAAAVWGDALVGVISAILTFLILVISEIIPKTLGAVYWRGLAPAVMALLVPTIWIMWPLVMMARGLTHLIAPSKKRASISREEFLALADVGVRDGVVSSESSKILQNLFRLNELTAGDIMTPRTVVFSLSRQSTVGETMEQHPEIVYSRIPIFEESSDTMTGFVLKQDVLLEAAHDRHDQRLEALERPAGMIPADTVLQQLLDHFLSNRNHMAFVMDEYGGLSGVVTLEDLLETLLGMEIMDEVDTVEDMQELARRRWKQRARELGIDDETNEPG